MNPANPLEFVEVGKGHEPESALAGLDKVPVGKEMGEYGEKGVISSAGSMTDSDAPTEEDLHKLHRVSGAIPWTAYTIAFVELCERFSYYGTTVVFVNFIQQEMPPGSTTGAAPDGQPGALGMGQRASTGLTTFNAFWAYVMPILGAYVADEYLGRFNTILAAIAIALVGHVILIISAIPPVIQNPNGAIACFAIGLVIMGVGVGGFKSNISPLIAEQYRETKMRVVINEKTGQRELMDPAITVSRIFLYFYMMINIGSLVGQICMVFAEKYVGFWLSYTLPTLMFCLCPMVLFACRKKYNRTPPTGSVLAKALHLWTLAMKGRWSINPVRTYKNMRADDFWQNVKPSRIEASKRPAWMTFDDMWVDQVRRGFKACTVFLWFPIYWLSYNQMVNNLTSQAATMELNGVPNDIVNNLNPLSLIIMIPIFDRFIYPSFRKMGINFTPLKRIFMGFVMGSLAMVCACVIQVYIYRMSPCGNQANSCDEPAPINVWVQTLPYVFIGMSEIFASITGLEYAFTKAPKNMRSLVTSIFLFMTAVSAAISQGLVALSEDPLLVWNYGVVAVLAALGGIGFWLAHRKLDKQEDALNMLPDSAYGGRGRRESAVA
ncbi:hypothetical protein H2201_003921 [Coniosporium apollinis]|uniref:POT family proton-dependent oligopeptide transporter n=2 Tax=Coniosporium TaxID=2810619 RepID=A0ABQ9NXG5_9PEZI|nr:hypothetical protein H2199_002308 [Cladosporium sp. JES 115]KAJ9666010.1 hypothetical protein H2201_003921 [Coniosporium apollinis]